MSRRIPALEKFKWRGYEFRQVLGTSTEVQWQWHTNKLQMRLLYRDIGDPAAPPEFTAIIRVTGVTTGEGTAESADAALARAERDLLQKVVKATRVWEELKRRRDMPPADPLR